METPPPTGHLIGAIFSASSDAVIVVDAEGSIVLASAAVTSLFGYFPEELVGEPIEVLVPPERRGGHVTHRKRFSDVARARRMGSGLQLFGLTRDGREVPIDVSLDPTEVDGRRYVAAFVRDATERLRAVRQLEAVNEVTGLLLTGASLEETIALIMAWSRELVGAKAAWIVTPSGHGSLVISAADGPGTDVLVGIELSETTSRSAEVLASREIEVLEEISHATNVPAAAALLGLGTTAYVPLASEGDSIGVLVVAREQGAPSFDNFDLNLVGVFAGAAAVALTLGNAREQLDRLRLIEEDERIARDLHDMIVQRAFAVGMSLQAVRQLAPGPVLDRIDAAVQSLDDMIRDLRNMIFRLSHPIAAGGVREELFALADEMAAQLGFSPRIACQGPVDHALAGELSAELFNVCREALSNVARHAHASEVHVVLGVENGWVTLSVADDGIGVVTGPTAGNGLPNMLARAQRLGGTFELGRREPSGTLLTWSVPVRN
jgi:PAS domain S-box-containing protein